MKDVEQPVLVHNVERLWEVEIQHKGGVFAPKRSSNVVLHLKERWLRRVKLSISWLMFLFKAIGLHVGKEPGWHHLFSHFAYECQIWDSSVVFVDVFVECGLFQKRPNRSCLSWTLLGNFQKETRHWLSQPDAEGGLPESLWAYQSGGSPSRKSCFDSSLWSLKPPVCQSNVAKSRPVAYFLVTQWHSQGLCSSHFSNVVSDLSIFSEKNEAK